MIKNIMRHSPELTELSRERDIRTLLSSLRRDFYRIDGHYNKPLRDILRMVEQGSVTLSDNRGVCEIDLSEAKDMITRYRHLSEGGCCSCLNRRILAFFPDEKGLYCALETESDVNERTGLSPMIGEYMDNENCPYLKHRFRRVEEVISE